MADVFFFFFSFLFDDIKESKRGACCGLILSKNWVEFDFLMPGEVACNISITKCRMNFQNNIKDDGKCIVRLELLITKKFQRDPLPH